MRSGDLLRDAAAIIDRYLCEHADAGTPVFDYHSARDLRQRFDVSLGTNGVAVEDLLPILESCLRYSVRTGHPQFLNQLYGGFDRVGLVGDLVSSAVNTSMYTYEVAPLATLLELELIEKMNSLIGFDDGEGVFCTGGSNANLIGILCARNRAFPEVKTGGLCGDRKLMLFVSDQAHYSFLTAANVLGIGQDNVISVKTDVEGRMIPAELDAEILSAETRGACPLFVGATAGTTVLGAFDPLAAIAEVCRDHGVWMHVDGAWGGPVLLSEKHRDLLDGAARADSFAWDAHKLMGVTLTCTAFLTRHRGALRDACSTGTGHTEYLFHETDDSTLDLGRNSLQCGRRTDALRLWLMWKHLGDRGFARRIDRLFELARLARKQVVRHPNLELAAPTRSLNVCFRHVPDRGVASNAFNLQLRERLRKSGKSFVNFSYLNGDVVLRLVFANPALTEADLTRFFRQVTETADELSRGVPAKRRRPRRRPAPPAASNPAG
jgi:glutamate/tyrosine decarboxylase-like PLP-dependent enzyme